MKEWRPKTKGWLFVVTTVLPEVARMWAKHAVVAVLAQMERKFVSARGGVVVLNREGRRPETDDAKSLRAAVYQHIPVPRRVDKYSIARGSGNASHRQY